MEIDQRGEEIEYIHDPLKSLQALMSSFKNIEKHQVTYGLEKAKLKMLSQEEVLSAPRAGLNRNLDPEMYTRLYRFFIFPKKQHDPKGEIIASLRGTIEEERLKELFGWKMLPEKGD